LAGIAQSASPSLHGRDSGFVVLVVDNSRFGRASFCARA
jgi:hypothetical protein